MQRPAWLDCAFRYLGTKELPGAKHNPKILEWWRKIRAPFTDDETPWCAAFVGGVLEECGLISTRSAAARSYAKWGQELQKPVVGAVVIFWRGTPQAATGHVGFIVGKDSSGNLMVIGGNQGDAVTIKPFALNRVVSYRWPNAVVLPSFMGLSTLPIIVSNGILSTNEA